MIRAIIGRLRALVARSRHEGDLDEELRYHLDREVERNVAAGMTAAEARTVARRAFGSTTAHKESVRAVWRWLWVEEARQDALFALRGFRREPTVVLTVMVTIGLGVGLNAAAFTLFNAYVLRPAPVRDPYTLQSVVWHSKAARGHRLSWDQYRDFAGLPIVTEAIGYRDLYSRVESQSVVGQFVTGNFFTMLGIGPSLGRVLQPDDAVGLGAEPIAVLNHRYWVTRFGGDSSIVGRVVRVRGVALTVVGVAPDGFDGLDDSPPDFWAPLPILPDLENRPHELAGQSELWVVARFRDGIGPRQAGPAIEQWLRASMADRPEGDRVTGVALIPKATPNPPSREMVVALLPIVAAFGLILLAACANVASVMVARGVARQREMGIRLAIGAGRPRIVRQLLTESVLLSVAAAGAAVVIARVAVGGSVALLFRTLPETFRSQLRMASLEADGRVYFFIGLASVFAAVAFGLAPAVQATRPGIARATRGEFGDDIKPSRLRRALVVGQIAVAAVLLITTGILLQASHRARRLDIGFSPKGLVALDVTAESRERVVDRLRRMPEVRGMTAISSIPLIGARRGIGVQPGPGEPVRGATVLAVSPDFFAVLGIALAAGRPFAEDEARSGAPVAIVTESLARELWGGRAAVDQLVSLLVPTRAGDPNAPPARSVRVVGVSPDVVTGWIGRAGHQPTVIVPATVEAPGTMLLVQLDDASKDRQLALERTLTESDPGVVDELWAMTDVLDLAAYPFRLASWIGMAIGAIALLLTLTGVYGVLAFLVARRNREIGVRIALGASPRRVVGMVMAESTRLAAIGIGIGLTLAVVAALLGATVVEAVDVFDPAAYLGGVGVVLVACVAGALIPSRRAARVEPLEAIRAD